MITVLPFLIWVDTRERYPYTFVKIPGDSGEGQLIIRTKSVCLPEGDYAIGEPYALQDGRPRIAIERKTINDLYSTILGRRGLFENELARLNELDYAAVVVEEQLNKVFSYTMPHWKREDVSPRDQVCRRKAVIRSILAWQFRYATVRWWFLPTRRAAEIWTIRLFQRWWKDRMGMQSGG